jgi:hypothetical protein
VLARHGVGRGPGWQVYVLWNMAGGHQIHEPTSISNSVEMTSPPAAVAEVTAAARLGAGAGEAEVEAGRFCEDAIAGARRCAV